MADCRLDIYDSTGVTGENWSEFWVAWKAVNFLTIWLSAFEGLGELRFTDSPKICERLLKNRVVVQYVTWQALVMIGVGKFRID